MHRTTVATSPTPEVIVDKVTITPLEDEYSDRIVRVHNEGTPEQRLETLERSDYYLVRGALPRSVKIEIIQEEVA